MSDDRFVEVSSYSKETYGIGATTRQAMINYGYALMIIAGGDGEVSEAEMNWLINNQKKFGVPEDVIEMYPSYDYKNGDLESLLPEIVVDIDNWEAKPNLLYHAIQMCSADEVYADEERAKVLQAAKLLKVSDEILLAIHALIEMENAVTKMRKAIFNVKTF